MSRTIAVFLLLSVLGCGQATIGVRLHSDAMLNDGRPFRLVLQDVDVGQFNEESYEAAEARALSLEPPVIDSRIIYPCTRQPGFFSRIWGFLTSWMKSAGEEGPCDVVEFEVERPDSEMLGLFFLFTEPDDGSWKQLIGPGLPKTVDIQLEASHVVQGD